MGVAANAADPGAAFSVLADEALRSGELASISDESLQQVFAAAVKLYTAKCEARGVELSPFGAHPVPATEAATAICAIMRAADLNFFDLSMWYGRGPRGA
jgi:hypothetical protein